MTPREPASQPAILKAKGRPKTPVPTTETIIFPSVCAVEAPAGLSSKGTPLLSPPHSIVSHSEREGGGGDL